MTIHQKLISGFAGVILLIGALGYFSLAESQRALEDSARLNAIQLAVDAVDQIDHALALRIETFREYTRDLILQKTVQESNIRFGRMKDVEGYITGQNRKWLSNSPDSLSSFMRALMDNALSEELREKAAFYKTLYGHDFIGKIVVTNKFGANVAQTGRTTDFRQDDELWWKHARENGICICGLGPDISAGVYSVDVGIRVEDEKGNFQGVIKVVLNVQNIIEVIGELSGKSKYETSNYKLLDSAGLVIYDESGQSKFLEDISRKSLYGLLTDERGFYAHMTGDEFQGEKLISYARSKGVSDFGGIKWVLVVEFDAAEVYGPSRDLRFVIISLTLALVFMVGIIGVIIAKSISNPLRNLARAAKQIGAGDLTPPDVNCNSSDEMGILVAEFHSMAESLRASTAEFNRENEERTMAQDSLRKSEEKYQDLFEYAPIAYFSVNADGSLARMNKVAEQMFGYGDGALIGQSVISLYADTPDGKGKALEILKQMALGQGSEGQELQMQRANGELFWVSLSMRPVVDDFGHVLASRSTAIDITERKAAEEALLNSERAARGQVALLDHLYTAAPIGLGLIDTKYRFVRVNDRLAEMFGRDAQDYVGHSLRDVVPHIAEEIERNLNQVITSGESTIDTEYRDKDHVWQVSHYPLCATDGEILGVSVVFMDITAQRQNEQEFRLAQFTLENSEDAAFWVGSDARVLYVNKKACESLGYTRDELLNMTVIDFAPDQDLESWSKIWQEIKTQGSANFESSHRTKSGQVIAVEMQINYLEFEDQEFMCAFARDITVRKKAEETLRLTQFAVDHATDCAFWIGSEGQFVYVNDASCKSLEYSREELLDMTVFAIDPEFPREHWADHWQELKQHGTKSFESVHQTKSGRTYPVEIQLDFLEFEGIEYIFAYARDITPRKRAEAALRSLVVGTTAASSDEFFGKLVIEISSALDVKYAFVGELEPDAPESVRTIAISVDRKLVDNFVYELAGAPCENVVAHRMCHYPDNVASQFPEDKLLAEMGVYSYLGAPLFDTDGRPLGLLSVMHDGPIANIEMAKDLLQVFAHRAGVELGRKRTEIALQKGEELLRATLESTGDGILAVNDKLEVTHTNRRFVELFRIPQDILDTGDDRKLLDFAFTQFAEPESYLAKVQALYKSKEEDFETLIMQDGRVIERYSCPLIQNGNIAGRVWSFREVTERVRAEEQEKELRESLERAKRMESMGILAGGVAHDLNNTLGPLVGYPEMILQKLPLDSPVRDQIKRMGKSASEAAEVIQDLLALARRGRYEMKPVCLNTVLSEYLESRTHSKLVEERPNVSIQIQLDESLGNIKGSAPHLSKVIMNLMVNAFDAMSDGGTIEVKTSRRSLTSLMGGYADIEPGDYVILQVKDTGNGIEPELLEKIFEPYFSKKVLGVSGSGLGLSVVYGVVKDHKGYYDVFSTPGEGAEFVLYFPATEEKVIVSEKSVGDIRGSQKILIIDDESEQRTLAAELLSSLGYAVNTVENGRQAVEFLKNESVDILVLDMIMEDDFDGLDTYKEILKTHPNQKAIVVSGFSATERVQDLQRMGATEYVKKPYTRDGLGVAVRKELDKKSTRAII